MATVERKTANDLISSMISGRMRFLMAELAALPRAAVVVEEGYSKIFKHPHVAGSVAAERLAEIQAQFPACADRVLRDPTACRAMDLSLAWRVPVRT